jgi:hypothetical protein
VYLHENQIADISAVSELTSLKTLYLTNNPLNVAAYCIYLPLIRSFIPEPSNLSYDPNPNPLTNDDIMILIDFAESALNWLETDCGEYNYWCDGADLDRSGDVNLDDVAKFAEYLFEGTEE